jgi:HEAT repeat protein
VEDEDDVVRNNAVGALAKLESPKAIGTLTRLLADPFARIRVRAALALGEMGARSAVPALIPLLDDESTAVARATYRALQAITAEELEPEAAEWREWWERQIEPVPVTTDSSPVDKSP